MKKTKRIERSKQTQERMFLKGEKQVHHGSNPNLFKFSFIDRGFLANPLVREDISFTPTVMLKATGLPLDGAGGTV